MGVKVSPFGAEVRTEIRFHDLHWERHYNRIAAYGQSKLANLMFTYELQRRLAARTDIKTEAVAAHPGGTNTRLARELPVLLRSVQAVLAPMLFQSPKMGALPTLRAATDPDTAGGHYYGPSGFLQQRGHPERVESSPQSHDVEMQGRLWAVSEELTGVSYRV